MCCGWRVFLWLLLLRGWAQASYSYALGRGARGYVAGGFWVLDAI